MTDILSSANAKDTTMKITIAEFKAFQAAINEAWNDNWYIDGPELDHGPDADPFADLDDAILNGNKPDSDIVKFVGQDILLNSENGQKPQHRTTLAWFKQWRLEQTHTTLAVTVPKDKVAAFEKALKDLGGTLITKPAKAGAGGA